VASLSPELSVVWNLQCCGNIMGLVDVCKTKTKMNWRKKVIDVISWVIGYKEFQSPSFRVNIIEKKLPILKYRSYETIDKYDILHSHISKEEYMDDARYRIKEEIFHEILNDGVIIIEAEDKPESIFLKGTLLILDNR
jgi:hypothetical protein